VPCTKELHVCEKCTNPGHLENYCPVNATPTENIVQPGTQAAETEARKSPPPTKGVMSHGESCLQTLCDVTRVANVTRIDTITRIKLDAVNQAFVMLAQGFLPYQIIEFMAGPYRASQTPHPAIANARMAAIGQRYLAASSQPSQQVSQPPVHASSFIQPSIERPTEAEPLARTDSSTWRRIEPKPTGPSELKHEDVPGTYTLMQQRFDQGALAKTTEQQHLLYMMSREGALLAAHNTPLTHEAISRMQAMAPSMEDATLQALRRTSQPTPHILLQQGTSRMGSVTPNTQDAALASLREQTMSRLQKPTPNMQDTASQVQSYTMTTETTANGDTENGDDTGDTKLKTSKKKLKLYTRAAKETTPGGTPQGPRCPKCIKGHKRCTHRTQEESPASNPPLGSSPLEISSTPPTYVPSAGVVEGYTPAPIAMPDHLPTLPATSVEVPVQAAAKKAAPKRKR
jgi:hypothetical protein